MSQVRNAREDDVAGMLELIRELAVYEKEPDAVKTSESDLREHLFGRSPQVYALVAEDEGELVGIAIWFLTFSTWEGKHGIHLEDLYVRESQRGRGTGKALLSELARIAVDRGYRRLEWAVLDWNAGAIGFYDALGASAMDGWITGRLDGNALEEVAR